MIKNNIHLLFVGLLVLGCGGSGDTLNTEATSESDSGAIAPTEPADSTASTEVASTTAQSTADAPMADPTVIPGEKFGSVTSNTSRQALEELFDTVVLSDEAVDVGEGMTQAATRVDLGDSYSFTVVWADASQTVPLEVRNIGSGWIMPEGIQIGTSFSELQSILGEFELFGLGWDYGGTLMLDNTSLDDYKEMMFVRLRPDTQAQTAHPGALEAVMGDQLYDSNNPNFEQLEMSVSEIVVMLN